MMACKKCGEDHDTPNTVTVNATDHNHARAVQHLINNSSLEFLANEVIRLRDENDKLWGTMFATVRAFLGIDAEEVMEQTNEPTELMASRERARLLQRIIDAITERDALKAEADLVPQLRIEVSMLTARIEYLDERLKQKTHSNQVLITALKDRDAI